jgi:hypothetical protein
VTAGRVDLRLDGQRQELSLFVGNGGLAWAEGERLDTGGRQIRSKGNSLSSSSDLLSPFFPQTDE